MAQTDAQASPRARLTPLVWFVLLTVFVLYPLSAGPILKFCVRTGPPGPVLNAAYAPLSLLYNNCSPVHEFYDWYLISLWKLNGGL